MNHDNHWHPTWYKPEHGVHWDRVKEAVRRDWQQTKHDLHMGGHQLSQKGSDTLKQAAGKEDIPSINDPQPQKIIGDLSGEWERVEAPMEYGFSARRQFGSSHEKWDEELASDLRKEWESSQSTKSFGGWDDVKPYVRHGYDYKS